MNAESSEVALSTHYGHPREIADRLFSSGNRAFGSNDPADTSEFFRSISYFLSSS